MVNYNDDLIGKKLYWINNESYIIMSGFVVRTTNNFCILINDDKCRKEYRKSKHLLFENISEAQADAIIKMDLFVRDNLGMNIMELSKIFKDLLELHPEKFI